MRTYPSVTKHMRDSLSGVSFFEITSNLRFTQSGPFEYLPTNYS